MEMRRDAGEQRGTDCPGEQARLRADFEAQGSHRWAMGTRKGRRRHLENQAKVLGPEDLKECASYE